MSLDLSNKKGRAHNTTDFSAADFSGLLVAAFDSGDVDTAGNFLLKTSTALGDIDAGTLPTTLVLADGSEGFTEGTELTIVKTSTDGNKITFTDPVTTIAFNYVDRQGESLTLVFDTSTGSGRWVAKL